MQSTLHQPNVDNQRLRRLWLPGMAIGLALLFLSLPWPIEHKAHALLHGLCAQQPGHTYQLGNRLLPFDARMTGIYGGFMASALYLVARGRYRAVRVPPLTVLSLLAIGGGLMAVDGMNSLMVDMGRWHAYEPRNPLRLMTGLAMGIAIGAVLCYLAAMTFWRRPVNSAPPITGLLDLVLIWLLTIPFVAVVLSGSGIAYFLVTALLIASAFCVYSLLSLIVIVVLRRVDLTFDHPRDLGGVGSIALLTGMLVIAALSGGRFLLEWWLGVPSLS